ncbi:DNA polymerase eta isoform X2 [Ceratina calcarata]|nr:DNA polymerase eta isoform X2 [Ceratina calcarata]
MRGEEAKKKCPDLLLASVPCLRGKADTSRYRSAGRDVIEVIRKHCNIIERASVDEAYLDITDIVEKRMSANLISSGCLLTQLSNTFIVGYSEIGSNDEEERSKGTRTWIKNIFEELQDVQVQKLAVAGLIVEEIRADIFDKTGFRCSAGISQNKILAKLACGLHKPNRQTILPPNEVSILYSSLPVKKVRNLGGKFGDIVVESLNCNVMGDLLQYSLQYLQKRFDEKTGLWLYNIARGIDNEPVTTRLVSKSIGACKKFPGRQAITSSDVLRHWAGELSAEVCERLEKDRTENERRATLVVVCYHYYQNKTTVSQSRSYTLNSYKPEMMANRCVEIVSKSTDCPIAYLGISAGKFVPAKGSENFRNFFKSNDVEHSKTVTHTVTKNLESTEVNTDDVNSASTSKSETEQNSVINMQLSEQVPNSETDWSPTSRRLNKLINSMNKRNKRKQFEKIVNSPLNDSFEQSDFKESFFMNAFNQKDDKSKDTWMNDTEVIEVNVESKDLNENDIEDKELDRNVETNDTNIEIEERPASSSTCNEIMNAQSIVKLQEIFPDLNNIDPNVVALLPVVLQEEAKLYMKAQSKKDNKKEVTLRMQKGKSKPKTSTSKRKKNNDISNFLVKRTSPNSAEVPSKKCFKCYQIIPVAKYQEHCDFHVAESLQWEMNSIIRTDVTRKDDTSNSSINSFKRRASEDILKSTKSHKTVSSFLL